MSRSLAALAVAAASIGSLHSLAPDHWIPFAAVARARGWSVARTMRVTLLCGFGHVTVSALLGLFALLLGRAAFEAVGHRLESMAGLLLTLFGVAYGVWGLRRVAGQKLHGHHHAHYDHVHDPSRVTVWGLFLLFSADPCVAVIPIMLAAAPFGALSTLGIVLVYEVATLGAMLALVLPAHAGARRFQMPWLETYGDAVAGGVIASAGIAVSLLGCVSRPPGAGASSSLESIAADAALRIEAIEIRLARLPLVEPFETSFGREESRLLFLVRLEAEGAAGWGEVVAGEAPLYSYETVGTARHAIRDCFAPALMARPIQHLADLAGRLARFRGHPMARAGLELAYVDLVARLRGEPLSRVLGGTRERVPVGVSLGIQPALPELLERIERHVALGYQRIKLKIKPGWDVPVVAEARRRHPGILLSVDANAAYTLSDRAHLRQLDAFDLLMIEQPLAHDDLLDHAELQRELRTDLCLDESITGVRAARQALALGSCRIINVKVGRVGGYSEALPIHDLARAQDVPVWCGGMLESGIGRAHNLALASLPGFRLPGDISASRRYFTRDLVVPPIEADADGTVDVPRAPGLGVEVDLPFLASVTEAVERLRPPL